MTRSPSFGGIELGGTKVVCAIGSGPDDLVASERFATGDPGSTLARAADFLRAASVRGEPLAAIGLAAFGPIELRPNERGYGRVLATPKPGWSGADVLSPISALGLPVGLETDVVGAALGEGRWGAARGLATFVYLTVGTGIGGGAVVEGGIARGIPHAEMGHQSVTRQSGDRLPGVCPYHRDCLEGLASGPAIAARSGRPPESLSGPDLVAAVDLEAGYLADGLRNITYTLAPQRIVVGGGVSAMPGLFDRLRDRFRESMGGYPGVAEHADDDFIVPAALGAMSGVLGALVVAERAATGAA